MCVWVAYTCIHTHLPHISWPEYFCSPQSETLTASVYQAHSHTQRSMKGFQLSILTTWLHTNIQIYSCTKSLGSENPSEENLTCCKGEFRWSIPICEHINCVQHVQLKYKLTKWKTGRAGKRGWPAGKVKNSFWGLASAHSTLCLQHEI